MLEERGMLDERVRLEGCEIGMLDERGRLEGWKIGRV